MIGKIRVGLALLVTACLFLACETVPDGTTIRGEIANSANLQVFLDKVIIGKASNVLAKKDIDASGNFEFNFPEGLEAGVYNLRIGAKRINLVLDGSEDVIQLSGDLSNIETYNFDIQGSSSTASLANLLQNRSLSSKAIDQFVDTTANPVLAAFTAYMLLDNNLELIGIQKKAFDRLSRSQPQSELTQGYEQYIRVKEMQYKQYMATQAIQVGKPAPDIQLPNPTGKEYSLSDLKGNVVLLDFWASWCRPCRYENPNVVKVYHKYKSKGFTIFSVSLDRSKDRWANAIEQDQLAWPYHVSDLQYWDSEPAKTYGVSGIPKTFLIDRDGKIAAIGLRGADQIEQALLKVL